jgi:hypothetical protein
MAVYSVLSEKNVNDLSDSLGVPAEQGNEVDLLPVALVTKVIRLMSQLHGPSG